MSTWEKRWKLTADPSNEEVFQRLKQMEATKVAEIGAGYGRVTMFLVAKGLIVYPIEPNSFLIKNFISQPNRSSRVEPVIVAKAGKVPLLPCDLYFSVRALEYCNFLELVSMSWKLKKYGKTLVTWERKAACARIRIAAWITLNSKIFIQTLIR